MSEIIYEGKWSIDGDKYVPGSLKNEEGRYSLYLNGTLEDRKGGFESFFSSTREVVFKNTYIKGITDKGKEVTLYGYYKIQASHALAGSGYSTESYEIKYIFEGVNLQNGEILEINSVGFMFDNLFEWYGKGLVEFCMQKKEGEDYYSEYNIRVSDDFNVPLGDVDKNRKLELMQNFNVFPKESKFKKGNNHCSMFKSLEVSQTSSLHLKYKNKVEFDTMLEDIEYLNKLYSLIFGERVTFFNFRIEINNINNVVLFGENMLFKLKESSYKTNTNLLFSYQDIGEGFNDILHKWFSNTEKYKLIFDIYFSTIENKGLHIENYFLNIIQAIEGYYYINFGTEERIGKEDYKAIKKDLNNYIKSLDIENKDFLVVKPNSKRIELRTILTKLTEQVELMVGDKDYIVECRHKLSHGDNRDFIYKNLNRFYHKTLELRLVLELLIIKDLICDGEMFNGIKKNKTEEMRSNLL